MPVLMFKHEGCAVITSSWTASWKKDKLTICYLWEADGISMFNFVTSIRRVTFYLPYLDFCHKLDQAKAGPVYLDGDN